MSRTNRLNKEEARSLLSDLLENKIPPRYDDYFLSYTVSNLEVENFTNNLVKMIEELGSPRNYFTRILLGAFGVGKTHFLKNLHLKLRGNSTVSNDNTIIIKINLRWINNPKVDFQIQLLRGLLELNDSYSSDENHYLRVLQVIYQRIIKRVNASRSVNQSQKEAVLQILQDTGHETIEDLFPLWRIPRAFFDIFRVLSEDETENGKRDKVIRDVMDEEIPLVSKEDFIDEFIRLGKSKNRSSNIATLARSIAHEDRFALVDILFRLLKFAGYQRVILFIDELEHIEPEKSEEIKAYQERATSILNMFFLLHEIFVDNCNRTYPAVAQIMTMPENFLKDVVRKYDTATETRWRSLDFPLDTIKMETEIFDDVIRNMISIYKIADYAVPSKMNTRDYQNNLKTRVYTALKEIEELATMRNLIGELIVQLDRDLRNPSL